ncbi:MAG TPA: hypothetical protein VHA13_01300, partial [Gammaproteobacteria bacterium]|nr:hypothetical protein [Gammaproteobacteria bacterium]
IINLIIAISLTYFSGSAWAKTLNLYEEPKDNAKTVGTVDPSAGIIPIYTPEKSTWMKVADPRNGNVGWLKIDDINKEKNSEYTFTQRFINTGPASNSYQVIQFGTPDKKTVQQIQDSLKKQQAEQAELQNNINKSIQKMVEDMRNLYKFNNTWYENSAPLIMPVIVMPSSSLENKSSHKK